MQVCTAHIVYFFLIISLQVCNEVYSQIVVQFETKIRCCHTKLFSEQSSWATVSFGRELAQALENGKYLLLRQFMSYSVEKVSVHDSIKLTTRGRICRLPLRQYAS